MSTHTKHQTLREERQAGRHYLYSAGFRVGMFATMTVMVVLYVMQMSVASTKGYEMSNLQQEITKLKQENRELETQIATSRSMESIRTRVLAMNLVDADAPTYLNLGTGVVARR